MADKLGAKFFKTEDIISYWGVKILNILSKKPSKFFAQKLWEAFAVQKHLQIFQQKYYHN